MCHYLLPLLLVVFLGFEAAFVLAGVFLVVFDFENLSIVTYVNGC